MSERKSLACFVLWVEKSHGGIREPKYRFAIGNPLNGLIPLTKELIHLWHSRPWDSEVILLIFPTFTIQMNSEAKKERKKEKTNTSSAWEAEPWIYSALPISIRDICASQPVGNIYAK